MTRTLEARVAEALREAARDTINIRWHTVTPKRETVSYWLRRRADELERGA
jgi:hypothetical protein